MINRSVLEQDTRIFEEFIDKISSEYEKLARKIPKGSSLRATKHRNNYQYFIRDGVKDINGTYIKRDDCETARKMAQAEYYEILIPLLQKYVKARKKSVNDWIDNPFLIALSKLPVGKRILITNPFIDDEDFVIKWLKTEYCSPVFPSNKGAGENCASVIEYHTRQGLQVRSKSEVIIADILDEMSIPFLYEKPLSLVSGTVHPDFTLLDLKERKEIYWEHFGMMDDIEYRNTAFLKIRKYEESGYYQGSSMIWTFETSKYPINTRDLRKMITSLKKTLGY